MLMCKECGLTQRILYQKIYAYSDSNILNGLFTYCQSCNAIIEFEVKQKI